MWDHLLPESMTLMLQHLVLKWWEPAGGTLILGQRAAHSALPAQTRAAPSRHPTTRRLWFKHRYIRTGRALGPISLTRGHRHVMVNQLKLQQSLQQTYGPTCIWSLYIYIYIYIYIIIYVYIYIYIYVCVYNIIFVSVFVSVSVSLAVSLWLWLCLCVSVCLCLCFYLCVSVCEF